MAESSKTSQSGKCGGRAPGRDGAGFDGIGARHGDFVARRRIGKPRFFGELRGGRRRSIDERCRRGSQVLEEKAVRRFREAVMSAGECRMWELDVASRGGPDEPGSSRSAMEWTWGSSQGESAWGMEEWMKRSSEAEAGGHWWKEWSVWTYAWTVCDVNDTGGEQESQRDNESGRVGS